MKIEVDLNDIFCDEDGEPCESIQQSVERQVVALLTKKLEAGIGKQIDSEVSRVISTKLQDVADEMLPRLAEDMINAEYHPVSTYGDRKEPTTFRKELVKMVSEKLVYKKAHYSSDENVFTQTVNAVISENIKAFQAEFNKLVTDKFRDEAIAYAVDKLRKTLGITDK